MAAAISFAVLVAAACQGTESDDAGEGEGARELVVWAGGEIVTPMTDDPEGAGRYGLYLKETFEEEHPGVTVTLEDHGWDEELRQNLVNSLLAGTAPDVVVGENFFQQYAELDALLPIDISEIEDNLIPGTYRAAQVGDSVYGLSAFTGVFGFERNCAVVEAAGLDCDAAPETWDDLLEQAAAITEQGNGTYGYTLQGPTGASVGAVFRLAVYLSQAGATLCKDDCTTPFYNDPKAVPVYEFIRELHSYAPPGLSFNPDEAQIYTELFRGTSGYQMAGSWHPGWATESGCADCRYSMPPIPEGGEQANVVVGNVIFAALKEADEPELAQEWVTFMARDDVQDLVPVLGRLPSTRSALERHRPDADPAVQQFIDILLDTPDLEVLPQWREEPQQMWTIWNNMFTKILTTDEPVQQLMDQAQAEAEAISG